MKPILALVLLVGCGVDTDGSDYAEGLGTPESPIPGASAYAVVTRVDLSLDTPALTGALASIRAFAQNPAHAFLARPTGMSLSAALPTSLRDRIEGWMNTELDKVRIGTKTVRQYATDVVAITENVLDGFMIESSLSIAPGSAAHTFTNLNFTPGNLDVIIPIGGLKADGIAQRTTADVAELGALSIGTQKFSLALGSHAWQAINLASTSLYNGDLSLMTSGVNCTAIADTVAAKCYSGSCVGHATDLAALCTTTMASLVDDLRAQIAPINVSSMVYARGNARLVDDGGDGIADHMVDGTWELQVDAGTGVKAAKATFTARRR